ncbi:MAG: hypothetical protein RLZZ528_1693 [Pseudomonadota bacterium]
MKPPAQPGTASFRWQRFQRPLLIGFLIVAMIVAVIGIAVLSLDLGRKIRAQATASSDNVQWALSQVDIEFLTFALSIEDVDGGRASLKDVRRRFDIFYSRMETVRKSGVYAPLREVQDYRDAADRLVAFLDRTIPLIDGPDAGLQAALPALKIEVAALRNDTRRIALTGIEVFSKLSDVEREGVARTLTMVAALTLALILSLVTLIVLLLRLDRVNRRNVQRNLETLARLESVVMTALDGVIVADQSGRMLEFNPAAEAIFGYSRAEAVGAAMADLIIPAHLREAHRIGMERYLNSGERHVIGKGRIRLEARKKDGSHFPVEVSIARAMSEDGEIFVSFLRDLSAQVAAEKELLKARDDALAGEKAKAELLAVMSHEMRTPLNGMLGTLELLEDTELAPKQREYLRIMGSSGRLLLHHVNDVLDISRLESGKMTVETRPVDLQHLIGEIFENQQSTSTANGNRLRLSLPADGRYMVAADPARLRQILMNLVGNAIKFTRNGEIAVEIEHLDALRQTEFRVIDTGIGIAPENIERIFDDFVTLDPSYSRSAEGTGLGLGIARRLVHALGGQIGVESEPGEGSLFWVRLPLSVLAEPARPAVPDGPAQPARGGPQTGTSAGEEARGQTGGLAILVVEDNAVNRLVVREFLQKDGYRVDEAHDGEEGVRLAAARRYDLILMDISMPRKDGVAATIEIRTGGASQQTPIVALTAHALPEETRRFTEAGMQAILNKPVNRKALRETIARVVQAPGEPAATAVVHPGAADAVDLDQLRIMADDLGHDRCLSLLSEFVQGIRETLAGLTATGIMNDDAGQARRAIHMLAGSAGVFGATALRERLAEMETALKSGEAARAAGLLPRLELEAAATIRALDAYRAGLSDQ